MSSLHRRLLLVLLAITVYGSSARPAQAAMDFDPQPPMGWADMLGCEQVVVAQYAGHQDKTLSLKVVSVLKGSGVKAGDQINVALKYRYSLETGAAGWASLLQPGTHKPDNIPKLCYQGQMMNPGGLVPIPILDDAREPAIYFFPKAAFLALDRRGQVQPEAQIAGWQQALMGQPTPLLFRLTQTVDSNIQREAEEELYLSRDSATLDQLFAWLTSPSEQKFWPDAEAILATLGDKQGDVYGRASRLLLTPLADNNISPLFASGRLMAHSDPTQALHDFAPMLASENMTLREVAVASLGFTSDERALALLLPLVADDQVAEEAIGSLRCLLEPDLQWPRPQMTFRHLAQMRDEASPQIAVLLASHRISDERKKQLRDALPDVVEQSGPLDLGQATQVLSSAEANLWPGPYEQVRRYIQAHGAAAWVKHEPTSATIIAQIVHDVTVSRHPSGVSPEELDLLFQIAPKLAGPLLDQALAVRATLPRSERAGLLALAIKYQHRPLQEELISAYTLSPEEKQRLAQVRQTAQPNSFTWPLYDFYADPQWLLASGDAKAYAKYLSLLDTTPDDGQDHAPLLMNDNRTLLEGLYPEHGADFFRRVEALLASPSVGTRMGGVQTLDNLLFWDFDFNVFDYAPVRERNLRVLRPILEQLAPLSEKERHAFILRQFGITLNGAPSAGWLPTLTQAALRPDLPVAQNALALIAALTGVPGCPTFISLRPRERKWALSAFFQDRKIVGTGI